MGIRRELACLSLLLLMVSQLETPCFAVGYNKLGRFKGGSAFEMSPGRAHNGFRGNADKDGDGIFGGEKRKVYTGPNPLHNR